MGTCFLVLGAGQEVFDIEDDKPCGVDAVIAASGGPDGAQSALLSSVKFSTFLSAIESEISPRIQGFASIITFLRLLLLLWAQDDLYHRTLLARDTAHRDHGG